MSLVCFMCNSEEGKEQTPKDTGFYTWLRETNISQTVHKSWTTTFWVFFRPSSVQFEKTIAEFSASASLRGCLWCTSPKQINEIMELFQPLSAFPSWDWDVCWGVMQKVKHKIQTTFLLLLSICVSVGVFRQIYRNKCD